MNTGQEARRAELTVALQRIQGLAEWARCANAYIDEHNAPPPDGIDEVTREELVEAMEDLGDLMQRYADSLRGFADREPSSECSATRNDGAGTAGSGTLLKFRTRSGSDLMPPRGSTEHRARPYA